MTKYCVLIGPAPLIVEELACRQVGHDELFFKNAALYVKSCVGNILFGQSYGKVRDTDISLIREKRDIDTSS